MLKGHPPRVIYHQVKYYTKIKSFLVRSDTARLLDLKTVAEAAACEDRVLDGPASGEQGSKGRN